MKRRHVGGRKYGKKFARTKKRTRAINAPQHIMRGGFRL